MAELTDALEMTPLSAPFVVRTPINARTDYGISGHCVWQESGTQIHTWPESRFITCDIFSCKPYSEENAVNLFKMYFKPEFLEIGRAIYNGSL